MRREFYYPSMDKKTQIHAVVWKPAGDIRGILQISHGMVEYIGRYEEFAEYLAERGYVVAGNDHLGHGGSVKDEMDYGHFPKDGNRCLIGDIHHLRRILEKKYPGRPYYMLGHSMGSYLLREYMLYKSNGLTGAIVMGTGQEPRIRLDAGQAVCRAMAALKGWNYRSRLVNALCFGGYSRHFRSGEKKGSWLTSDEEIARTYARDPLCSFVFTLGGYEQLMQVIKILERPGSERRIRKELPILLISGADDPVGGFGRKVRKAADRYRKAGIRDVDVYLYPDDRHEVLNELDRENIYEDIFRWMEMHNQIPANVE